MARKRRKNKTKVLQLLAPAKIGRPPTYRPSFAIEAARHLAQNRTVQNLAGILGVDASTLYKWKRQYPEFSRAMETSGEFLDDAVENALHKRAVGFNAQKTKIIQNRTTGQAMRVRYSEPIAGDVNAQQFWLVNRRAERWKNKQEILTGNSQSSPADLLAEMQELESKTGMYARLGVKIETVSAVLEMNPGGHFMTPPLSPALSHDEPEPTEPESDSEPPPDPI